MTEQPKDVHEGDHVRFKPGLPLHADSKRPTGVVTDVFTDPAGIERANVELDDGTTERLVNVHQVEKIEGADD